MNEWYDLKRMAIYSIINWRFGSIWLTENAIDAKVERVWTICPGRVDSSEEDFYTKMILNF